MRSHARRLLGALLLLALGAGGARAELPPLERVLLIRPEEGAALDPEDRHLIAKAMADSEAMDAALADEHWKERLRHWLRARWAAEEGRWQEAHEEIEKAAWSWSRRPGARGEPLELVAAFDRDRVRYALEAGEGGRAQEALLRPLATHAEDPRWQAVRATVALRAGQADAAVELFDRAWTEASPWERRDRWFGERGRAHLAAGDSLGAGEAWLDWVEGLRRPSRRRAALAIWDARPELRRAVARPPARVRAVRWLARNVRREEALALAREGASERAEDGAACHVLVAEQLYRLRRHEELRAHLARPRPAGLDPEEVASLDAYPWGVRRREGELREAAQGFDLVARQHAGTARAHEALWEAAWMYELDGETELASLRYQELAQAGPAGRYAAPAAARALLLALRADEPELVGALLRRFEEMLGDDLDAAAALWLGARALGEGGPEAGRAALLERLAREHPGNPFLQPPPLPLRRGESPTPAVLFARQREALQRVASHLGLRDAHHGLPHALAVAERFLELGLFEEGEDRLDAAVAEGGGDDRLLLRALAVAWRCGRPERQARLGWRLHLRLSDGPGELERELLALAYPTPYAAEVLRIAEERALPAGLLWSLMRRESFYDAGVVSIAGAHGLLQLMPATARQEADRLGDSPPAVERLRRPELNLRLGGAHLADLLRQSGGNVYQALAAYNAGMGMARRWIERTPEDAPPSEAILWISYSETRAYVYHVLRYWGRYGLVHPELDPSGKGLAW